MPTKPYYEHAGITIYHGDCREVLPALANVDLVLTDPPYGLNAAWKRTYHGPNGKSRLWGETPRWDRTTEEWMFAVRECGKHAVVWGANNYSTPPTSSWLIWDKIQKCSRAECELAWSTLKSGSKVFRMSRIDAYVNQHATSKTHPAEKPVQLMRWCLSLFPFAELVLDPFMGTGSSLIAARDVGRRAVGIEIEERYCEIAAKRLAQEVLPLEAVS